MKYRIVADSSADILTLDDVDFVSVPLHIIVGEQDFIDDETIDIDAMQKAISEYKGKTSTACPGPESWKEAFGDADVVFCVTLTSKLSGAYTSANIAKQMYEEGNPGRKVFLFDTLSTGPEMTLLIEALRQWVLEGYEAEEIEQKAREYMKHTHLLFSLASLDNFANNGRVSPILAKGIGILGIRIVGMASQVGDLQPIDKARGDNRAIEKVIHHMKELGYVGGKLCIAHNNNVKSAELLLVAIKKQFGECKALIHRTRALCSYYAEPESILIGFEV